MEKKFDSICNKYLREFCQKHDLQYASAYWIANEVGTIVEVSDLFIAFCDLRYDIDNNIAEHEFLDWVCYEDRLRGIELQYAGLTGYEGKNVLRHINYRSWCKGAPKPYTEKELDEIEEALSVLRRLMK